MRAVTNMSYMFCRASSFNQPLDTWEVSADVAMNGMLEGATSFQQSLPEAWQSSLVWG